MKAVLFALVLFFAATSNVFAQEAGSTGVLGIPGLTTAGAIGVGAAVVVTAIVISNSDDDDNGTTGTTD